MLQFGVHAAELVEYLRQLGVVRCDFLARDFLGGLVRSPGWSCRMMVGDNYRHMR